MKDFLENFTREELEEFVLKNGSPTQVAYVSGRPAGLAQGEAFEFCPPIDARTLWLQSREEGRVEVVVGVDGVFFGLWAERNALPDGNETWITLDHEGGTLVRR